MIDPNYWSGKRVLVTGHSGFKGGWLSLWLKQLGAKVYGLSLRNDQTHSFYKAARVCSLLDEERFCDINKKDEINKFISSFQPEVVFHLAAQPIVSLSYEQPLETFSTNVIGLINLLECLRNCESVKTLLTVTSDKCYKNSAEIKSYRETDPLGGDDPYSASKACAEIVNAAYFQSFFKESGVKLSSARAGNVIGGGDWSSNRLLPDIIRSLYHNSNLDIRNPLAIRPWQHVLEPLLGYVLLAQQMSEWTQDKPSAWNFGPFSDQNKSVDWILKVSKNIEPKLRYRIEKSLVFNETKTLMVDNTQSVHCLSWRPILKLEQSLERTFKWYRNYYNGANMRDYSEVEIEDFSRTFQF